MSPTVGSRRTHNNRIHYSSGSAGCYLSAVAIFKNEAAYLDEWLAFCVLEGIEHVLLYDNSSTDNSQQVLQPWINAGIVELIDWPILWTMGAQTKAYSDALRRLRGRTKWAAFIDIDEYLFSPTGNALSEVLKRYEGHPGIVVNWQCYGTSGHRARPPGLTIERYTGRAKTDWARNCRVKTIVDPSLALEPAGAHLFKVQPGHALVDENLNPVRVVRAAKWRRWLRHVAAWLPYVPIDPYPTLEPSPKRISVSNLRINHYVTRSAEELAVKYKDTSILLKRDRRAHGSYHDRNEVEDPVLVPKGRQVREIIAAVRSGRRGSAAKRTLVN